jgi:DNA (cytosine-5)-methyltransferase 1
MPQFTFYDFFAGVGMAEFALAPEWRCTWANDFDPRKARVHADNFDHDIYHTMDVAEVTADSLPDAATMAWASFPCQDLSLAGWRRGMSSGRSGAFWPFWRLMLQLYDEGRRPPIIAIENVAGLLYGSNFSGLCEALAALDMQFGAMLIDADRFVPQSRPRVFIVAVDAKIDVAPFLESNPQKSPWATKSVRRAHDQLPATLQRRWCWWKLPDPVASPVDVATLIEEHPTLVQWHSPDETARLLSLMSPLNAEKVQQARELAEPSVGFVYKRTRAGSQKAEIRFDGVAGCLRTPYGGSSRQTVVLVQNGVVRSRLLSPREAARLMGLPDSFVLPNRYNDAYRAMGDGVAVPAVAWLGKHLLTPLADHIAASETAVTQSANKVVTFRRAAESHASKWALAKT